MNKKKEITSILKRLNNLPYLLQFWAKKKPNQKFLYRKNYNGDWVGKTFRIMHSYYDFGEKYSTSITVRNIDIS